MTAEQPVLVWFRDDLRIADHPALSAAAASGQPVVCLYVLDEESPGIRALGGAARWWLAGSLRALDHALRAKGARLVLRRGAAADVVRAAVAESKADGIYFNRRYDDAGRRIDAAIAHDLAGRGVTAKTFQANLLFEPDAPSAKFTRVFTPFWKRMRASGEPRAPLAEPKAIKPGPDIASESLDTWRLEPANPDWAAGMRADWNRGEAAARTRLRDFLDQRLTGYAARRDRMDIDGTSRLSPHLRFGEISPFQIWRAAQFARDAGGGANASDIEKFLSELGWREFSYQILFHCPDIAIRNLQQRFDDFPWRDDEAALRAWQRGRTGYPVVDAAMRQLWQTGWMHNRARMVVASFLVKHLLINWRDGEAWFWDTLVDADAANNPASWQWVAGSGMDAAPYFRVFNPVLQGEKFDPDGDYVRRFVPELTRLPDAYLQQPWQAPPLALREAGIEIGRDYPAPIVDHAAARARALAAFDVVKKQ
jgi:deoxyribodipyrimidine photo-lyase